MENLKRPMPVIFIPTSSEKLIKEQEEQVMTAFLEPFMRELEYVLIHGFDVSYNFPLELISPHLIPSTRTSDLKLRAMPMYWTRDHPAQTKVAGFKLSGYQACGRCHMFEKPSTPKVVYPDNRRQAYDPPPDLLLEALKVFT